jgi:NAD(P)-dependent dehydrogenase (short-subunit alcohol dehydrogenase family)
MRLDVCASEKGEGEGLAAEEGEMERVVREAVGWWGGIDVLVNCAGMCVLFSGGGGGGCFVDVFVCHIFLLIFHRLCPPRRLRIPLQRRL